MYFFWEIALRSKIFIYKNLAVLTWNFVLFPETVTVFKEICLFFGETGLFSKELELDRSAGLLLG